LESTNKKLSITYAEAIKDVATKLENALKSLSDAQTTISDLKDQLGLKEVSGQKSGQL
jgi:HPt (histidine-containing phosphotransfer) domain-containing protein